MRLEAKPCRRCCPLRVATAAGLASLVLDAPRHASFPLSLTVAVFPPDIELSCEFTVFGSPSRSGIGFGGSIREESMRFLGKEKCLFRPAEQRHSKHGGRIRKAKGIAAQVETPLMILITVSARRPRTLPDGYTPRVRFLNDNSSPSVPCETLNPTSDCITAWNCSSPPSGFRLRFRGTAAEHAADSQSTAHRRGFPANRAGSAVSRTVLIPLGLLIEDSSASHTSCPCQVLVSGLAV